MTVIASNVVALRPRSRFDATVPAAEAQASHSKDERAPGKEAGLACESHMLAACQRLSQASTTMLAQANEARPTLPLQPR